MSLPSGYSLNFPYTGAVEEITLPRGKYKLECWGAQGGNANITYCKGGRGGYASGILNLKQETRVFVRSGQAGPVTTKVGPSDPAFNGGGTGDNTSSSSTTARVTSGGGASDVRIGEDSLFARVIVAGAGGGSGYFSSSQACDGGYGGGNTGGNGEQHSTYVRQGYGGTQTEGGGNGYNTTESYGSFGEGGSDVTATSTGVGGGGGWYGGGASDGYYCGGGGGSGFVWTGANAPNGYLLTEEHYLSEAQNLAGNTAFLAPDGTTETGHSGDGYVRITALKPETPENFRVESEADAKILLAWDSVEDATGYRLRRGEALLLDTTETSAEAAVEPFADIVFSLAAYNEIGESAGTSLTYFNVPENPVLYLVTDRTQEDVKDRNSKGVYQNVDLNRVGAAVEYLQKRLLFAGILADVSPRTDWLDSEWMSAGEARVYLDNVKTMRAALAMPTSVPAAPADMANLTYAEANHMEEILVILDTLLTDMVLAYRHCGITACGMGGLIL